MTQTATYTVEAFVEDVRAIFASTEDPHAQAQGAANHLKALLAVPGWLEEKLNIPEEGGYGRFELHLDEEYGLPGPGFWLMCSIQTDGQESPVHDHGVAWVIYGVYEGAIEQSKWRWFYKGEGEESTQIKQFGKFIQNDRTVAFFLPGEIHKTLNVAGGRSIVVRLESQKLDRITRYQYDPIDNSVKVMNR